MSSYNFITQYDVELMSDELWTELGHYYAKYLSRFPFLSKIGFTGSSMYNVTLEQLVKEIES